MDFSHTNNPSQEEYSCEIAIFNFNLMSLKKRYPCVHCRYFMAEKHALRGRVLNNPE